MPRPPRSPTRWPVSLPAATSTPSEPCTRTATTSASRTRSSTPGSRWCTPCPSREHPFPGDMPFHLFRVDVDEIVLTTLGGDPPDHLVIETWRERRGTTRVERR